MIKLNKSKMIFVCITFFLIGAYLNPLEYYHSVKTERMVNELLLDETVFFDLFKMPSNGNFTITHLSKDTLKIVIDNDKSFVVLVSDESSIEVFELISKVGVFN